MSDVRTEPTPDPAPQAPAPRHRVPIQRTTASPRPSPAYRPPSAPPAAAAAPTRPPEQRRAGPEDPVDLEPPETDADEAADPPPPRRRSRLVMAIPLTVCVAAVLGALAAGSSLALRGSARTDHRLETPAVAAGMPRDVGQERALRARISPIRDSFELQFMGRLHTFVSAVYRQAIDGPGTPRGPVVFVGATVDTSADSRDFIAAMRASAGHEGYRAVAVDAGPGARAVCLGPAKAPPTSATSCAWSTGDSVGEVVPTRGGWTVDRLSALMRSVRADVEVPAS